MIRRFPYALSTDCYYLSRLNFGNMYWQSVDGKHISIKCNRVPDLHLDANMHGRIVFLQSKQPRNNHAAQLFFCLLCPVSQCQPSESVKGRVTTFVKETCGWKWMCGVCKRLSVNVWTKLKCQGVLCHVPHVFKCSHSVSPYIHWWLSLGNAGFNKKLIWTLHHQSVICSREVLILGDLERVATKFISQLLTVLITTEQCWVYSIVADWVLMFRNKYSKNSIAIVKVEFDNDR